jgi:hypothetical protein
MLDTGSESDRDFALILADSLLAETINDYNVEILDETDKVVLNSLFKTVGDYKQWDKRPNLNYEHGSFTPSRAKDPNVQFLKEITNILIKQNEGKL